jgi:hypothetical protein
MDSSQGLVVTSLTRLDDSPHPPSARLGPSLFFASSLCFLYVFSCTISFYLGAPVRGFLLGANFHEATQGKSSGRCTGKEREY